MILWKEKLTKEGNIWQYSTPKPRGHFDSPLVYDLGVTICDKNGTVYDQQDWVIKEIFDNRKMMDSAFYGKKRPIYVERIKNRETRKVPYKVAKKEFNDILDKWGVNLILAYNLRFDMNALKTTTRYLQSQFKHESKKFLNRIVSVQDIWGFACETIYQQKGYHLMVNQLGFYTPACNPLTNAEVGYRYISGEMEFSEKHTALDDTMVEVAILAKCYQQHQKYTKGILSQPWRLVAKKHKELY